MLLEQFLDFFSFVVDFNDIIDGHHYEACNERTLYIYETIDDMDLRPNDTKVEAYIKRRLMQERKSK